MLDVSDGEPDLHSLETSERNDLARTRLLDFDAVETLEDVQLRDA